MTVVALRPVSPDDTELLFRLYATTREQELAAVPWNAEQRLAFLNMQIAAMQQHYALKYPEAQHSIVLDGECPAGRLWVDRTAGKVHILDLTILPEHRGAGIGTAVLRELMAEGRPVSIYVESFNPSLRLFQRLGFGPVAEAGVHMLMEWRPNGSPAE